MSAITLVFNHAGLRSELDWLAADVDGWLGYFATAGAGPIPAVVERKLELVSTLDALVVALPVRGDAVQCASEAWHVDDWVEIARRGLFAYDWRRETQRYELIARPSIALHVSELLHRQLKSIVEDVKLPVRFMSSPSLVATPDGGAG